MAENIDTLLKESRVYQPTAQTKAAAYIQDYESAYKKSIADPEAFWSECRQGAGVVLPLDEGPRMELSLGQMVRRRHLQHRL